MKINNLKITHKKMPAVITVEASIIFPIIIFIMALIITLCFYLHDKIVSNSLSYRDCIYASNEYDKKSDFTDNDFLETTINSFLLMYKTNKSAIEYKDNFIRVITDYMNTQTAHTYSNFLHCDKLRKYSIILKLIKEES